MTDRLLLPFDRRYDPLDSVANQLAALLADRMSPVVDLVVKFGTSVPGFSKVHLIQRRAELRIEYSRAQRALPDGYVDTAAVTKAMVPRYDLHLFGDQTGPQLYVYLGDDWANDWEVFEADKRGGRRRGLPRFVRYSGACPCYARRASGVPFTLEELLTNESIERFRMRHTHPGLIAPLLIFARDNGGEDYSPEAGETRGFWTATALTTIADYLQENVLQGVLAALADD